MVFLWCDLLLMQSYMDAVRHVYERGEDVLNERTGSYTRSIAGLTISHDCSKSFPIPTARRVALRIAFDIVEISLIEQFSEGCFKHKNIKL